MLLNIKKLITGKYQLPINTTIAQYEKDLRSDDYEEHSINAKISKVLQVINLTGKNDLNDITEADARLAREQLKRLPANVHKMKEFKDLDLVSSIQLNNSLNKPTQSTATIKGKLQETSAFYKYLMRNKLVKMNPFEDLTRRLVSKEKYPRKPLEDAQITALFDLKWFKTAEPKKNFHYWILLLLRFSGARVNEIAQLTKDDIKLIDKIWCLVINDSKDSQRLKSTYSQRIVPIADILIELGFLDFVSSVDDRLFPELEMTRGCYSHSVSKWASYWRKKLEFKRGNDLHSLRHNFVNELKRAGVKNELASELVGHAREGFTYRVYGHNYPVSELHQCVNLIKTSHVKSVAPFKSTTSR